MKNTNYRTFTSMLFSILLLLTPTLYAKESTIINSGWKFIKSEVATAQLNSFDDSAWESVTVPHTWNAADGQDGGSNYYRGIGWYRKHITPATNYSGKIVYLRFGGISTKATVYFNGTLLGTHYGGYGAFMFDVSNKILLNQDNVIAVQADNSSGIMCPPLSADFTHDGGIIRNVELITANPLHINTNEYISNSFTTNGGINVAQPGIIIKQSNVSETSADLKIITKLRNAKSTATNAAIEINIKEASGRIVKTMTDNKTIAANDTSSSVINSTFNNPHLWNGLNDPYLYHVEVNLKENGVILDTSVQPLGVRYFSIDVNTGFYLNGKSYPLRGISLHESKIDKGHAILDTDRKEAIDLLRETGNNYLRLSHYQHGDFTYNYLDSLGIICWTEIPNINSVGATTAENATYTANAVSAMYELVRQQYNHPSIVVWGISNEIDYLSTISPVKTDSTLNVLVKSEDTYRPTTLAAMGADKTVNMVPDMYANNRYDGWYSSTISGFATAMDALHAKYPTKKIGVSEYGAGANPLQHEYPAAQPSTGGPWHPEEYQNMFHEQYLKAINARPYFWCSSLWVGIDFASDGRGEGLHPGINDKGLINFDRTIKKDIFYWYKANWNKKDIFTYISSRRFTNRTSLKNPVRIYSNCDSVYIQVNGTSYPVLTSTDHIFMFDSIQMIAGANIIKAIGLKNKAMYRDSVVWNCIDAGTIPPFPTVQSGDIQINFQRNTTTTTPTGYLKDDGSIYADRGNGYSYGWNATNTTNGRERSVATDKRYDTFVQMQAGGTFTWSIALPNHWYRVSIACGDPSYTDSYHKIEANGLTVVDFIPTSAYKYGVGTVYVNVTNGTLTVKSATVSINAKIAFIHITPVAGDQTGINTIESKNIHAFINSGNLIVQSDNNTKSSLEIYNMAGQMVVSKAIINHQETIPVKSFHKGIYVLHIKSGNQILKSKIIV